MSTRIIHLEGDLNFGDVQVGCSDQSTMTIYNDGNSMLTVNSITYPTGFSGNWNSGTISAGSSRPVTVTFSPTEQKFYSGNITVNSDGTGTNTKYTSGTGTTSPCTYTILPTSQFFGSNGGSDKVYITTSSSSCSWTAESGADWITITSGSSGTGNGTVYYLVSANTSTSTRTGTMTIAGQSFTVTQSPPTQSNTFTIQPGPEGNDTCYGTMYSK